ncbi:hypothetical protein Tco_0605742, partial [Tanacetum coccineum]
PVWGCDRFYGTGGDGSNSDVEEAENEQERTLERMKNYYYSRIHDQSKCEEAEEQHTPGHNKCCMSEEEVKEKKCAADQIKKQFAHLEEHYGKGTTVAPLERQQSSSLPWSFGLVMAVVDCSSSKRASVIRAKEKASPQVEGLSLNSSIFSSEYFISENLHPELPGPGDHIVDFPEGKIGVYTKKIEFANFRIPISQFLFDILAYYQIHLSQLSVIDAAKVSHFEINCRVLSIIPTRTAATKDDKPKANTYSVVDVETLYTHQMDLFNLVKAPNPTKVKTRTRQRNAHEGVKAGVHGPAAAEQEIPVTDDAGAMEAAVEPDLKKEVISMGSTIKKRRRQRDAGEGGSNAPAKVLRKDHDAARTEHIAREGKSLADMSIDTKLAIHVQETYDPPVATQSVSDPDPLSSSKKKGVAGNQDSKKSTPSPPITGSLGSIYQPGWGVPNSFRLDTLEACQDVVDHIAPPGYFSKLRHLPNDEFLSHNTFINLRASGYGLSAELKAEINMKKKGEKPRKSEVTKELEDLRNALFRAFEVCNAQLSPAVPCYRLSIWRKRGSCNCRSSVGNWARIAPSCHEMCRVHGIKASFCQCCVCGDLKGPLRVMSEGLKYGVEHGKAGLELTAMEAYDPEADSKYVAALHDLKDLNYPLIDELEQLKDAPLDVIMASLYLDSDTGEDAPQFIRDIRSSSSQLKIPAYPEVRNPRNPWACKDEILLEDATTSNISCAEKKKKKKSRVICHTHRVGLAHHARSDGIPMSVPTVAPQGLQILLADAATQTEDEESPRLLRSKSLPAMFNLD